MHIDHLRYLLEVAAAGSINKASRRFFMNQQHLSKIILALEADFGTAIFERTNKGVTLTEQGSRIVAWAETVVASYDALRLELDQAAGQMLQSMIGQLYVSSVSTIYGQKYNGLIQRFSERYPNMSLVMEENSTREVIRKIRAGEMDVGIILLIVGLEKKSELLDPSMQYIPCYKSKAVIYASPEHRLAQTHRRVSLEELHDEDFIIYKPYADSESIASKTLAHFGHYHIKYTVSNLSTFHDILAKGRCIHIGSQKAGYTPQKTLAMIPISDKLFYEVGLLVQKERLGEPPVRAFIDIYQQIFID